MLKLWNKYLPPTFAHPPTYQLKELELRLQDNRFHYIDKRRQVNGRNSQETNEIKTDPVIPTTYLCPPAHIPAQRARVYDYKKDNISK